MKNIFLHLIFLLFIISCKNKNENETIENETIENETKQIPEIPLELSDYNMKQVQNIYYYLWVDRWNNNGDIATTYGTNYSKVAEQLNIPVSKLKIDSYYYYEVEPVLKEQINKIFKNIIQILKLIITQLLSQLHIAEYIL